MKTASGVFRVSARLVTASQTSQSASTLTSAMARNMDASKNASMHRDHLSANALPDTLNMELMENVWVCIT